MKYTLKDGSFKNEFDTIDAFFDAISDAATARAENGEEEMEVEVIYDANQFIVGDYVMTGVPNAFNDAVSYWMSKKGYTFSCYCFTARKGDKKEVQYHVDAFDSYAALFDNTAKRMELGAKLEKAKTQDTKTAAEKVLADNGVAADETDTVLQAIGYALLDTELYPEEEV